VGFRDDLQAAQDRASALESELRNAKRENLELREKLRRAGGTFDELEERGAKASSEPNRQATTDVLVRRANREAIVMGAALVLTTALCWLGRSGRLPAVISPATSIIVGALVIVWLVLLATSVVSSAKAIESARGEGARGTFVGVWFALPFVLLVPVVGSAIALVRAVTLSRGRLDGEPSPPSDTSRATAREAGQTAASIYVILAVGWPVMVLSLILTTLGMSPQGTLEREERFTGRVVSAHGSVDLDVGERCAVTVTPLTELGSFDDNCRVAVTCGPGAVYSGRALCEIEARELVRARTSAGTRSSRTATLELDLVANFVTVTDDGARQHSVTIMLDTPLE